MKDFSVATNAAAEDQQQSWDQDTHSWDMLALCCLQQLKQKDEEDKNKQWIWPLPPAAASAVLPQTLTHFTNSSLPSGVSSGGDRKGQRSWAEFLSNCFQWPCETLQLKKRLTEHLIPVNHITLLQVLFSVKTYVSQQKRAQRQI